MKLDVLLLRENFEMVLGRKPDLTHRFYEVLFARHPADALLLEVGLGGRLDATNVVAEPLASVVDAIKKLEDKTGYQDIHDCVTISANPIPVSLPADKAFPKAITGVAVWDGTPADPKERSDKVHDLSDSQRFSIFVTGLSSGWVQVDPLGKGKVEQPVIRRKTLQLNFKRVGDRFHLDARDITFEPPAEWIYRASALPKPKGPDQPMPAEKEGKQGAALTPLPDLNQYVQPAIHRGN